MKRYGTAYMAAVILAALVMQSCDRYNFSEEDFAEIGNISLHVNGALMLDYSPERHQIGFSPDRIEFRVSDDGMADYFFLSCDEMPSQTGQRLHADLEYTTPDDIKTKKGIEFVVTDMDSGGLIWLWNSRYGIGAVVTMIQ